MPIEARVVASLVLGLKHQMVNWGWAKSALWADTDRGSLWCGDEEVISSVFVKSSKMNVAFGPGWEDYLKEAGYPEYAKLVSDLEEKLASGTKGAGKGAAKGKGKTLQ